MSVFTQESSDTNFTNLICNEREEKNTQSVILVKLTINATQ